MSNRQNFRKKLLTLSIIENPTLRMILFACGWIFTAIGLIGYVVPLLPGTIFILIATYCFSRSSERFHTWLINHKFLGRYIQSYIGGMKMPFHAKVVTWALLIFTLAVSAYVLTR